MTIPTQVEIRHGLARMSGLSPAVQAILPRLGDDEFDVNELSSLLSQDPVLAARVLRLANSPFYGLPRQVGSLQEAAQILGFSNLHSLVLSTGLIGVFTDEAAKARSLATAAAAASLARSMRQDPGQAYTAGLLHNLGMLLLVHFAPAYWQALDSVPCETGEIRLLRERQTFGYDHCELGAGIAGHWRFPGAIQSAIRQHPQPPDEPAETLIDLIHAAWVIVATGQFGDCLTLTQAVSDRLGLETPDGKIAMAEAMQAAKNSLGPAN